MSAKENNPISKDEALGGISAVISHHLRRYFKAHRDHLPPEGLYQRVLDEVERPLLEETLRAVGGNQMKAAGILGIHRNTLRRKMKG